MRVGLVLVQASTDEALGLAFVELSKLFFSRTKILVFFVFISNEVVLRASIAEHIPPLNAGAATVAVFLEEPHGTGDEET